LKTELDINEINSKNFLNFSGLCLDCNKLNIGFDWCKECNAKQFRQDFPSWTSGNESIDRFIQEIQLNSQNHSEILEWIPYNRLENIKYLGQGGFSTVFKANWLDGFIKRWSNDERKWIRHNDTTVALKNLYNSLNLNDENLNKV